MLVRGAQWRGLRNAWQPMFFSSRSYSFRSDAPRLLDKRQCIIARQAHLNGLKKACTLERLPSDIQVSAYINFARSLQHYHKIMDKATKMFVAELLDAARAGQSLDIHHIIGDMTFNVVGESSFGWASKCVLLKIHLETPNVC